MSHKLPSGVIWKLHSIAREIGISECTMRRIMQKNGIKIMRYKGIYWIPREQIRILIMRLRRSNIGLSKEIYVKFCYTYGDETVMSDTEIPPDTTTS